MGGFAGPVRDATAALAASLELDLDAYQLAYAPRAPHLGYQAEHVDRERAAWTLMSVWLCGYATGAFDSTATLRDAELWFYGEHSRDLPAIAPNTSPFTAPPGSPVTARALLPYLLDTHDLGTRRAVLRDREQATHQRRRRRRGVYYTPGDVARLVLNSCRVDPRRFTSLLDPAVGSGVFPWTAALLELVEPEGLFGIDSDPSIAERAATTLMSATLQHFEDRAPWCVWHLHRMNLATRDSLGLSTGGGESTDTLANRVSIRGQLLAGDYIKPAIEQDVGADLVDLFPELDGGAELVVSNPPYARMGTACAELHADRFGIFGSAPPTPATNTYLPFLELGMRLVDPAAGAMSFVVPLSLGFDSGKHATALREMFQERGGGWDFRFFDRTPDALFGDDIKTRNCVVTWHANGRGIATTPLLRWTSRTRSEFMSNPPPVTEITEEISAGVPKVGSVSEAGLHGHLGAWVHRLGSVCDMRTESPESLAFLGQAPVVAVAPTAYNWLNVVREPALLTSYGHDASSGYTVLKFASDSHADAAYAVLASRLVFWLWRSQGDGFHVTNAFLRSIPWPEPPADQLALDRSGSPATGPLAELGRALWLAASSEPVRSVNRGRTSIAFPGTVDERLISRLDHALFRCFDVPERFRIDLGEWYREVVVVDEHDSRRSTNAR